MDAYLKNNFVFFVLVDTSTIYITCITQDSCIVQGNSSAIIKLWIWSSSEDRVCNILSILPSKESNPPSDDLFLRNLRKVCTLSYNDTKIGLDVAINYPIYYLNNHLGTKYLKLQG